MVTVYVPAPLLVLVARVTVPLKGTVPEFGVSAGDSAPVEFVLVDASERVTVPEKTGFCATSTEYDVDCPW
jgi:hypothetical protein